MKLVNIIRTAVLSLGVVLPLLVAAPTEAQTTSTNGDGGTWVYDQPVLNGSSFSTAWGQWPWSPVGGGIMNSNYIQTSPIWWSFVPPVVFRPRVVVWQNGTVQPWIKWQPSNAINGERPPTVAYVKVKSDAWAYGSFGATMTTRSGLGQTGVTSLSIQPTNGTQLKNEAFGTRIWRIRNPLRDTRKPLPMVRPYAAASVRSGVVATKSVNSHVVTNIEPVKFVIKSNVEPSHSKRAVGYDITNLQTIYDKWCHDWAPPTGYNTIDDWPNRNVCDRHHIDTVVEWKHPTMNVGGTTMDDPEFETGYYGGGEFSVTQNAFDSPKHEWKLMGEGTLKGLAVGEIHKNQSSINLTKNQVAVDRSDMPKSNLYLGNDPASFPKESTIRVTVTDSTNAVGAPTSGVANGFFFVKWHLPYEKSADIDPWDWKISDKTFAGPVDSDQAGTVTTPDDAKSYDFGTTFEGLAGAAGASASAVASVSTSALAARIGTAVVTRLNWLAATLSMAQALSPILNYSHTANSGVTVGVALNNDQLGWNTWRSDPYIASLKSNLWDESLLDDPDGYQQCTLFYKRSVYGTRTWWLADSYNTNGFVSPDNIFWFDKVTLVRPEKYWAIRPALPPVSPLPPPIRGGTPIPIPPPIPAATPSPTPSANPASTALIP